MIRYVVLATGTLLFALCSLASSSDSNKLSTEDAQKKAKELVRKLGDRSFRQREQAARELLEMGGMARMAVEAAINDPDTEIRERCRRLLPEVLVADIRVKLKEFLADKEGKQESDLPGWKRFSSAIGKDAAARTFFATMLEENLALLKNLESEPKRAMEAYQNRCNEIYSSLLYRRVGGAMQRSTDQIQPKIHEFAALLLVNSDEKVLHAMTDSSNHNGQRYNYQISNLMYQPYFQNYMSSSTDKAIFRKLFVYWFERQAETTLRAPHSNMYINFYAALNAAQNADLKEILGSVEKLAVAKELDGMIRGQAICSLAKLGTAKHIEFLKPLLTDESVVSSFNLGPNAKLQTTQVRDVALGITIHLSGQKPADYDFDALKSGQWGVPTAGLYYYYMFGFEEEENRTKTFKKWNDFAAAKEKESKVKQQETKMEKGPKPQEKIEKK